MNSDEVCPILLGLLWQRWHIKVLQQVAPPNYTFFFGFVGGHVLPMAEILSLSLEKKAGVLC